MSDIAKIGQEMMLLGTYADYDISVVIDVLKAADDLYYNDEESFITDSEYDALRKYAETSEPHHSYFTGVGSEVRGGKIKLPHQMGSLDQVYIGEITDWVGNWGLQNHHVLATDKLDGTSAMAIYNTDFQIAYSRGDGIEGADISRHIKRFVSVPNSTTITKPIRGEVILSREAFDSLRSAILSRSGKPYKNARNMVAGLMNSKTVDPIVYDVIDFVAYEIVGYEGSKVDMLCELRDAGFLTPKWQGFMGKELTDKVLSDYLTERRSKTEYEIDGLVLDVDSATKRGQMNPTRDTLNPAFAIKYKVADASNQAKVKVIGVHWGISKHGYLKPRVEIEPTDLVGVTITFLTGFNAKFIVDRGIGPDAEIQITRSGDVIPFIQKTITPATPQMPTEDYEWVVNDQGEKVDIKINDIDNHTDVKLNRMEAFFSSIDAPMLKKGNVIKLYEDGLDTIEKIITANQHDLRRVIGSNGTKIYTGLQDKLNNIPLYKLMGSLPFFGRGVGVRKFKKLQEALGAESLLMLQESDMKLIERVPSFDYKTARKIVDGMGAFDNFMEAVEDYIEVDYSDISSSGDLDGQKIVFTGFRDKTLQTLAENEGGTMQSAVSGQTNIVVCADPNSNSGKIKKARDLGVSIMSIEEFKDMLGV